MSDTAPWNCIPSTTMSGAVEEVTEPIPRITIEAEETAIAAYKELIAATCGVDAVTHKLGVDILKDEEEHLYDLMRLKESITP